MALKIKWNDDRVKEAIAAILILGCDRLIRGETTDLVRASLAEYRADPSVYRSKKNNRPDGEASSLLTNPSHMAYYANLPIALEHLRQKMAQGKRQFNSLNELDNYLIARLATVQVPKTGS
jgi:hypothetical protein